MCAWQRTFAMKFMLMLSKSMSAQNFRVGFDRCRNSHKLYSLLITQNNRIVHSSKHSFFKFNHLISISPLICLSRRIWNWTIKMSKSRGKCVFNSDLAKKYPFIRKGPNKSDSDVKCNICGTDFNIANKGRASIEQHTTSAKHQRAMQAVANTSTVKSMFTKNVDYSLAAREGVWAYHSVQSNHSFRSSDCDNSSQRKQRSISKQTVQRFSNDSVWSKLIARMKRYLNGMQKMMKENQHPRKAVGLKYSNTWTKINCRLLNFHTWLNTFFVSRAHLHQSNVCFRKRKKFGSRKKLLSCLQR